MVETQTHRIVHNNAGQGFLYSHKYGVIWHVRDGVIRHVRDGVIQGWQTTEQHEKQIVM